MRIGQVAMLAGVTTRTVRHYHRLGLLVEPPRHANGYRDYRIDDLFALLRIRRFADSGVPLASIGQMLAPPGSRDETVVDDLRELLRANAEQQAELARRGAAIRQLLTAAETGRRFGDWSAEYDEAFAKAVEESPSGAVRDALDLDASFAEAAASSPAAPKNLMSGLEELIVDDESRAAYLRLLHEWTSLEGRAVSSSRVAIEAAAEALTTLFRGSAIAEMLTAGSSSDGIDDRDLAEAIPDAAQREVILAARRRLMDPERQ